MKFNEMSGINCKIHLARTFLPVSDLSQHMMQQTVQKNVKCFLVSCYFLFVIFIINSCGVKSVKFKSVSLVMCANCAK